MEVVAPVNDTTRGMQGRLKTLLTQLIGKDGEMAKKSNKVLPRGDYLEFARLVSVRLSLLMTRIQSYLITLKYLIFSFFSDYDVIIN